MVLKCDPYRSLRHQKLGFGFGATTCSFRSN